MGLPLISHYSQQPAQGLQRERARGRSLRVLGGTHQKLSGLV